tara:strand:- start:382 stop:540 length:159 start_codon:yes stop_codon:yes gene_type:complete
MITSCYFISCFAANALSLAAHRKETEQLFTFQAKKIPTGCWDFFGELNYFNN